MRRGALVAIAATSLTYNPLVFAERYAGPARTHNPVTISGTPPTTVDAGALYDFKPSTSDSNSSVRFQIAQKPSWARFNGVTGQLSGSPSNTQVGTYKDIVISVHDGSSAASLPAFSITVTSVSSPNPPASSGSATLTWLPPTQNSDGSPLTSLAGYEIVYGNSANNLSSSISLNNPGLSTYMITNLAPGTWYFALRAYTYSGTESALSNMGSKTIP